MNNVNTVGVSFQILRVLVLDICSLTIVSEPRTVSSGSGSIHAGGSKTNKIGIHQI